MTPSANRRGSPCSDRRQPERRQCGFSARQPDHHADGPGLSRCRQCLPEPATSTASKVQVGAAGGYLFGAEVDLAYQPMTGFGLPAKIRLGNMNARSWPRSPPRLVHRLCRNTSGNIPVMTAVGLLTRSFAFGFVVDFCWAEAAQTELNAIAHAATLAAIDPPDICVAILMRYPAAALRPSAAAMLAWTSAAWGDGEQAASISASVKPCASQAKGMRTAVIMAKTL